MNADEVFGTLVSYAASRCTKLEAFIVHGAAKTADGYKPYSADAIGKNLARLECSTIISR